MSLRRRFLLSLLAVLALMALPALYGAGRVIALRDIVLELRGQGAQAALAAGRLQAALLDLDRYQRAYVATTDRELAARMREAMRAATGEITALRASGYGDVVDSVGIHLGPLAETALRLETLVEQGQLEAATAYLTAAGTPLLERERARIPALAAAIDAKIGARVPVAQRSATTAGTATSLAVLVALALAGLLAVSAARVLTRPLDQLRFAMARVADGAFDTPAELPYERADEIGHLSRSFRTMTLRLAELDRMKAEFVGSASHQLKTPISVINGYAELMQEELSDTLPVRHRELLRSLSRQTQTLQRRVDQLLEISRMESGRLRLGLEEIDLRHFVDEVYRAYAPAARMREIRLELRVHDRAPRHIFADPDVLRTEIIGNLMGNALKFTPTGGMIVISVMPDGDRVHLEVADTGPGISEEHLQHIFEKYYQGRGTRGGSGLGLAIARAAVEAHGGRIEVQSRPGRGSRFRVSLPVRTVAQPPSHAEAVG